MERTERSYQGTKHVSMERVKGDVLTQVHRVSKQVVEAEYELVEGFNCVARVGPGLEIGNASRHHGPVSDQFRLQYESAREYSFDMGERRTK